MIGGALRRVGNAAGLGCATLLGALSLAAAEPAAATSPDFGPDQHWIGYGHVLPEPATLTRTRLQALKDAGATGIVTYASPPDRIQEVTIAADLGLKVILGVYDPLNQTETETAGGIWFNNQDTVVAINVGNEGLCAGRYSYEKLFETIRAFQRDTNAAITTSEPWGEYQAAISGNRDALGDCQNKTINPGLLTLGDLVSANLYSYYELEAQLSGGPCAPIESTAINAAWTLGALYGLETMAARPVILHESGYPVDATGEVKSSPGERCTEQRQADYYCELRALTSDFVYFPGFDDSRGADYLGRFGGLFTEPGEPRLAAKQLGDC